MDEELEDGVRLAIANHAGDEVEVVVLEHDDWLFVQRGGCFQDRVGEKLVDGDIACPPGIPGFRGDVRSTWGVPEVVLEEPEEGVADLVVVLVVHLGFGRDKPQAELRVGTRRADERFATALGNLGPLPVSFGHRRRDPDWLAVAGN